MTVDYLPRVADVPFLLGRPEELPRTASDVAGEHGAARAVARLRAGGARTGVAALAAAVRAARAELAVAPGEPLAHDPDESEANRDNDLAFGIVRVPGDPLPRLVDAALAALAGVVELAGERGTDLASADWAKAVAAVEALLAWLADPLAPPRTSPPPTPPRRGALGPEDGLRKWVRGHHLFMVLAQGGVVALSCLADAADRGDERAAVAAASAAVALMRGCEGALRFAGDVTAEQYAGEIRPTLMPPVAPPRMSGLHWRDHEWLIRALPASRPGWAFLEDGHAELVEDFRAALDRAYLAHRGVCEHFVGDRSPSLLAAPGSRRSAVGVLDQLRALRSRAVRTDEG